MQDISIRPYTADDAEWVIRKHIDYYAASMTFDQSFADLVVQIVAEFDRTSDPAHDQGLIAQAGPTPLGCVFCVRQDAQVAKLRLFYLEPQARGQGLGRRLLTDCMGFAKSAGYRKMVLWTHASQTAACALYAATGWRLVRSEARLSFGAQVVEQGWETTF